MRSHQLWLCIARFVKLVVVGACVLVIGFFGSNPFRWGSQGSFTTNETNFNIKREGELWEFLIHKRSTSRKLFIYPPHSTQKIANFACTTLKTAIVRGGQAAIRNRKCKLRLRQMLSFHFYK